MRLGSLGLSKNTKVLVAIVAAFSSCLFTASGFAQTAVSSGAKKSIIPKDAAKDTSSEPVPTSISDESGVGYARGEGSSTIAGRNYWRFAKESKFAYKLGTGFDSFVNEREQSQFFGFKLGTDYSLRLADSLSFRAKVNAEVSSGYAQSRFGENVGKSGIYVQDAALSWRVIDSSVMRAYVAGGALDQDAFNAPLFISKQPFPGLKQTLAFGDSKVFQFKVWAQQAIPTSKSLSTKTVDAEVTPSLMTETVEMKIKPNEYFFAEAAVSHFLFNNLPSAIAQESIVYGNTVEEVGPNTSRFKYRFEGLLARGEFQVNFAPRFAWNTQGYVIQNAAAPESYRNAQFIQSGFKIGLPGDVDLDAVVETFFSEDDAAPGFYNSSSSGHNNRKGYGGMLAAFFQRQRFRLKAEFVDADVINYNINQSRQQTLMIGFETFYEML